MRGLLGELVGLSDQIVITDMDPGLEHLSRGTAQHVETMLVVTEPYYKSMETAGRAAKLASELGIPQVTAVLNKVRDEQEQRTLSEFCRNRKLPIMATVPFDKEVLRADLVGQAPVDLNPASPAVRSIEKLAEALE